MSQTFRAINNQDLVERAKAVNKGLAISSIIDFNSIRNYVKELAPHFYPYLQEQLNNSVKDIQDTSINIVLKEVADSFPITQVMCISGVSDKNVYIKVVEFKPLPWYEKQ